MVLHAVLDELGEVGPRELDRLKPLALVRDIVADRHCQVEAREEERDALLVQVFQSFVGARHALGLSLGDHGLQLRDKRLQDRLPLVGGDVLQPLVCLAE